MTPEQRDLALDLAFADGVTRKISKEEFLRRFGEPDGQDLARRLLADAVAQQDRHDLEASMIVVAAFGVTPEMFEPLTQAATAAWHRRHEDVVWQLQELGDPRAIPTLSHVTVWAPPGTDELDARALASKAIWAMFKIGGPDAERALRQARDSVDDEDLQDTAEELLERLGAA